MLDFDSVRPLCPRCVQRGDAHTLEVGHVCLDDLRCCASCRRPLRVRVERVDMRGSFTRTEACEHCARPTP